MGPQAERLGNLDHQALLDRQYEREIQSCLKQGKFEQAQFWKLVRAGLLPAAKLPEAMTYKQADVFTCPFLVVSSASRTLLRAP